MRQRLLLLFIILSIPFYNVKPEETFYSEAKKIAQSEKKTLQTVLLLPFSAGNRMTEYLEGFLLALEDIKKKGISVNLQIFDIGENTEKLTDIFAELYWTDLDIVVGGLSDAQINLISEFCKKRNTIYVIPFTSKTDELANNPLAYQINTPQSTLFKKVSTSFSKQYANENILFFTPNNQGNKMDFVKVLQNELQAKGIAFRVIDKANPTGSDLSAYLRSDKNNVFVFSDDSSDALKKLTTPLKNIQQANVTQSITLFGHPTWQIYFNDSSDDFFRFNASFYSVFYVDPLANDVKIFRNRYNQWYSKELLNTYPKYGILGYDTGMYFLLSLAKQKWAFKGLQTDFYFENLDKQGGYVNTNVYFVEFNSDYTIKATQKK